MNTTTPTYEARPLRLDLIVRTSQRKREARSPQQQRDIAEACRLSHQPPHEIVHVHDSGRSESGKTMDRQSVRDAMERVRTGQTDGVIVALTDRLGRAPIEEAMTIVRELDAIGKLVVADTGPNPIDLSDPMAETMLVMQLQIARQFWVQKARGFKRSQRDAFKRGAPSIRTPLGYVRVKGGDRAGCLDVDPVTGPIITKAFKVAATDGLQATVRYLREHADQIQVLYRGQLNTRRWDTDSVRRMLRSRTYLGQITLDGETQIHAHEALTDRATWSAAQTDPRPRRHNTEYVLSGIARCGTCGGPLIGSLQHVHGNEYRRMRCANPECSARASISADGLERLVRDSLAKGLADRTWRVRFVPGGLQEAREALETAEAERNWWSGDLDLARDLGREAYRAGLVARSAAVAEAREVFEKLAGETARSDVLPAADELNDPEQLARAISATVDSITVRPGRGSVFERATISWRTAETAEQLAA